MAYLIKLLKLIKATHGKLKQRNQTLPQKFQTNTIDQLVNQIYSWTSKLFRKFQITFCNKLSKSIVDKQIYKLENSIWLNSNYIIGTK